MALNLSVLKRIGSDIINPVINVGKDIGDIGSQVAADVTNNPVAEQHATAAFENNPVTQFVGNNIVKPLAQFPIDVSQGIYNNGVAPALGLPTNTNPQQDSGIVGDVARDVGATGQMHQVIGSGIQTALTLGSGGISDAAEGAAGVGLKSLGDSVPEAVARLAPKVASNAITGGGFNAGAAISQNETPKQIAEAAGEGAAFAGALPLVKPVAKLVGGTASKVATFKPDIAPEDAADADNAVDTAGADNPKRTATLNKAGQEAGQVAKTAPTSTTQPSPAVPETGIPQPPIPRANTSVPEFNDAVNSLSDRATKATTISGKLSNLINQAQGFGSRRLAAKLTKVIQEHLSSEEDEDLNSMLEGEPMQHGGSPKVTEFYKALKPLYEQAHGIRATIDPGVGKVVNYSPRQVLNAATMAFKNKDGNILDKLKAIANLRSGHSESRIVGKFVDSKMNTHYGSRSDLGLVKHNDGSITDAKGNVFTPQHAGIHELMDNTDYKYETKQSANAGQYFGETLGLKARAEAMQALKADPNKYGLYTQAQVDRDEAPAGLEPVSKVKELTDSDGNPMYAKSSDVKELNDKFGFKLPSGPVGKTYDALSNVATQFIVLNPLFHGMNQLYQSGIAAGNIPGKFTGWLSVAKGVNDATEEDVMKYLDAGGHIPTYGSDISNALSRATGGATKANSKAMMTIETKLRAGLYKSSIESGMKPGEAIANIDKFLGDNKAINIAVRRGTLFAHYFRTMAKAIGSQVLHPVENAGATLNTAALAGITAAVSYGYVEATGNPNAHVRVPGELGLAQEAYDSAHGLIKGQGLSAAGVVTNHINPVGKEIAGQLLDKDLYTGQPIGNTAGDKLGHAAENLIAPSQVASKVTAGKRSIGETVANQLGLDTPHAKGYQAAPNFNGKVPFNTKGAVVSKTGDPTGYKEEQSYFNNLDALQRSQTGKNAGQLTDYLARSHDPTTGATIENSPAQSIQNGSMLFANNSLRQSIQKFEKSQPSHDPIWDLSNSQLKTLEQYKAMYTGAADKTEILQNNPWITKVQTAENNYYNNLQKIPGAKAPEASSQTPTYPVFNPQTTALLAQYDNADTTQRSALLENNASTLSSAFNDIANWTNAMRKAEGAPQLAGYPTASPQVQAILNTYDALPKGDGSNGGSPERDAWINANPAAYAQMSNYLTSASMYSLIKNATEAQFAGSTPDQQLLKDIKEVGSDDIATSTTPNGTTQYQVNPSLAYSQGATGGTTASTNYTNTVIADEKKATQARDAEKASKTLKYLAPKSKNKSVSLKNAAKLPGIEKKYKVTAIKVGTGLKAKGTGPGKSGSVVKLKK